MHSPPANRILRAHKNDRASRIRREQIQAMLASEDPEILNQQPLKQH
jgi:hypothetical protein